MNIYTLIFCFLSLGISTTHYGMEEEVPPLYRGFNWENDIHTIRENTALAIKENRENTALFIKKYNENLNHILEYAADQYQWKTQRTLSEAERKNLKIKLLRKTIKDE